MDIIADNKIPFLHGTIEKYGEVHYMAGDEISSDNIKSTNVLLIRTRTHCKEKLLEKSAVKFIGTATIGTDHIDLDYCSRHGITVANAAGCNAPAVMQYVISALLFLATKKKINLQTLTIGIIGVGNVGKRVADAAKALGMKVLINDPPREAREGSAAFTALNELLHRADIVTLHLPLQNDTQQFAGNSFFRALKEGAWFINASRGEVVDENALALYHSKLGAVVLDVWQNEPHFSHKLLEITTIATPHIAGYSLQGKRKASQMVLQALAQWCGNTEPIQEIAPTTPYPETLVVSEGKNLQEKLWPIVQTTFPILDMDAQLRHQPNRFEEIRNNYPLRNDFTAYTVQADQQEHSLTRLLQRLGFNIAEK